MSLIPIANRVQLQVSDSSKSSNHYGTFALLPRKVKIKKTEIKILYRRLSVTVCQ